MNLVISKSKLFCKLSCLVLVFSLIIPPAVAAFRYLETGMEAPGFSGVDIQTDKKIVIDSWYDHKISIVVFWATWSERSLNELEDLKRILDEFQDSSIQIIAINVESPKITAAIEEIIKKHVQDLNISFPVIIDQNLSIFYEYGVIAVPSTAIINSTGILQYAPAGYSLTVQDRIIDSINAALGIETADKKPVAVVGYTPKVKASRYYRLAVRLWNQRLYENALSNLDLSIQKDSLFSSPHNLRGQIFMKLDSNSTAVKAFEKALSLDSLSPANWAGYARSLIKENDYESAFDPLIRALELDENFTPAMMDLAVCFTERGEFDRALDSLEKVKELNPNDPIIYYYLSKINKLNNQPNEAAINLRRGLELIYSP